MDGTHGKSQAIIELLSLDIRIQLESLLTRREAMVQDNAQRRLRNTPQVFEMKDFVRISRDMDILRELLIGVAKGLEVETKHN